MGCLWYLTWRDDSRPKRSSTPNPRQSLGTQSATEGSGSGGWSWDRTPRADVSLPPPRRGSSLWMRRREADAWVTAGRRRRESLNPSDPTRPQRAGTRAKSQSDPFARARSASPVRRACPVELCPTRLGLSQTAIRLVPLRVMHALLHTGPERMPIAKFINFFWRVNKFNKFNI